MTQLDLGLGRKARDEAMDRVAANTAGQWKKAAERAFDHLAKQGGEFTNDQVWLLLEEWQVPPPHEPRALGPITRWAQRAGVIEKTGVYLPSERPACHGRPQPVYRPGRVWQGTRKEAS